MIPVLKPITVEPRQLNARLWELVGEELAGTISPERKVELDCLCVELEGGAMPLRGRSGLLRTEPCSTVSAVPGPAAIARNDNG